MSQSITKLTQEMKQVTDSLMQARADGDAERIEELEAELEEIHKAFDAFDADSAEDHRWARR